MAAEPDAVAGLDGLVEAAGLDDRTEPARLHGRAKAAGRDDLTEPARLHGRAKAAGRDDRTEPARLHDRAETAGRDGLVEAAGLDGLLEEVRDLRLTLAADLATAAGATELGETEIAGDIIEGDRRELARFLRLADAQLRGERQPTAEAAEQRWRRRVVVALPAIPLVGAMALTAAAASGMLAIPRPNHHAHVTVAAAPRNAVASTFQQFQSVVSGDPSAAEVVAAATALHQQLSALLQTAGIDPSNANEVAQLLLAERELLAQHQVPGTPQVLAAASKLAAQLRNVAKKVSTPSAKPSPAVVASPSTSPKSSKPTPSPTPSKSATSSPKPTHSASPSSSPTSSSSSGTGQIPHIGN